MTPPSTSGFCEPAASPYAPSAEEQGRRLLLSGDCAEALRCFRRALAAGEDAERWMGWARAQQGLGEAEEATEGFRRALELDPSHESARQALRSLDGGEPGCTSAEGGEFSTLTDMGTDTNAASYLKDHAARYASTMQLVPMATGSERLLELGASYHFMTQALLSQKGYRNVRCSDLWKGSAQRTVLLPGGGATGSHAVTVDNFDCQDTDWPYSDGAFDVVLFCEILEHLNCDPMSVLGEINRILASGGLLALTTPNIASAKSVVYAMKRQSPYVYGKFEVGGRPTDRHNREYTPGEVSILLDAAGFSVERLFTRDSWWTGHRPVLRVLAATGMPVAHRGSNIFCLARKVAEPRTRYPSALYSSAGTQSSRLAAEKALEDPGPAQND